MSEVPMKMYWRGEDIETLERDALLEIIRQLHREVEEGRERSMRILQMQESFAGARKQLYRS